jgi:DNA-binding NtrC family response regulator
LDLKDFFLILLAPRSDDEELTMRFFFNEYFGVGSFFLSRFFLTKSLRFKLLITLLPAVVALFIGTGIATYFISSRYLGIALHRTVRLQALSQARALERILDEGRKDLLFFAQSKPAVEDMARYLERLLAIKDAQYCELFYVSQRDKDHVCVIRGEDGVRILSKEQCTEVRPHPVLLYNDIKGLSEGEVWLGKLAQVELPYPTADNLNNKTLRHVVRFVTPCFGEDKTKVGYYVLGLDAKVLRNTLSQYNSPKSPIYAFSRVAELRYSFVFDTDGWMLYQSEKDESNAPELGAAFASTGYTGTLGKAGLPNAFLPGPTWNSYWRMVADITEGKQDLVKLTDEETRTLITQDQSLAYAPIRFTMNPGKPAKIYAGLAFVDTSRLTIVAGYKLVDVFATVLLVSVIATSLIILAACRFSSQPIRELTDSVQRAQETGKLQEIEVPSMSSYEASSLTEAINSMIRAMRRQLQEIQAKDMEIQTVHLKERVSLEDAPVSWLDEDKPDPIPEIVGVGPIIEKWKSDILKAAQADVDVLIFGETGTGKQLAAEAVHNRSQRSDKPFVSINCGALDENLLLDTLFGHMRGAYTEAKTERKGAFLEAHGGTLFLDEIQAASLRVQQALLRAISMRKIKPLGSDKELDVDVRLLAATNVDLSMLIPQKQFREDLYFRLKVVTVHTPPLRLHKENIGRLARHFLEEAMLLANKQDLALSKGALEKLRGYTWPGNVRELKNAITRAVVMTEEHVIQAEELLLEADLNGEATRGLAELQQTSKASTRESDVSTRKRAPEKSAEGQAGSSSDDVFAQLNERQKKGYAVVLKQGEINRGEYQLAVGGDLPSRTAIYDLQDLVKKGLLSKMGKGPATKYLMTSKS